MSHSELPPLLHNKTHVRKGALAEKLGSSPAPGVSEEGCEKQLDGLQGLGATQLPGAAQLQPWWPFKVASSLHHGIYLEYMSF